MRPFAFAGFLLLANLCSLALCQTAPGAQNAAGPVKANPFQGGQMPAEAKLAMRYTPDAPKEDTRTPRERCDTIKDKGKYGLPTDMHGVDLTVYMGQVQRITQANWKPLMPKEVEKPFFKKGQVSVCFALLPNGQIEPKSMVLLGRSGDIALDRAAWGAIENSIYPRLPAEFKEARLQLRFQFAYNPDRQPDPVKNMVKPPEIPGPLGLTFGYRAKL